MFFFTWLRQKTRDAVLAGISDAAEEVGAPDDVSAPLAKLRERLTLRLPAPAGVAAEPAAAGGNGRARKGK